MNNMILSEMEAERKRQTRDKVIALIEIIKEKKGEDIIALDVEDKTIIADWFVICSGTSSLHVKAICDEIDEKYCDLGLELKRIEGYNEARWIVLDFSYILVHIFHPEEREYYNVERLWIDPNTEIIKPTL